jgi:hypothetical protein
MCILHVIFFMEISQIRKPLYWILLEQIFRYQIQSVNFFRKHNAFLSRKHETKFRSSFK